MYEIEKTAEKRALLLAASPPGSDVREECEELGELAAAAGYFCAAQRHAFVRRPPKAATLVGAGAIDAAGAAAEKTGARFVVVGADLSSVQARNLENLWRRTVIDRSDLILEIFAARARTYESKLQVEMARCRRRLGRLAGRWTHLERQRGGIGLRGGPGEKQMEIDRRLLSERIKRIARKIDAFSSRQTTARRRRAKNGVLTAALVGYTNAGKSTLFNALARAGTRADGRLFDTVESTARRVFADGAAAVVSDTVGFIRNLPHELLAGFHATLQEAARGDLIMVVADCARADCDARLAVTHSTLDSIGAGRERRILVMNKIDKIGAPSRILRAPCGRIATVWLSGRSGDGVGGLKRALREAAAAKPAVSFTNDETETLLPEPTAGH
ncbi:MAG: GTPase HflX [Gammaproteobacteria bacterium]